MNENINDKMFYGFLAFFTIVAGAFGWMINHVS